MDSLIEDGRGEVAHTECNGASYVEMVVIAFPHPDQT